MRDLKILVRAGAVIDPETVAARQKGLICWRGIRECAGIMGCGTTDKNRKAKAMPPVLKAMADRFFLAEFGWAARTDSVLFVTGDKRQAESFGTAVACHALGAAPCIWSPRILDLSSQLADSFSAQKSPMEKDVISWLGAAGYRHGDLEQGLRSGNEVMLRAEKYAWTVPDDAAFLESPPLDEEMLSYEKAYEGIVAGRWVRHERWNWDGIPGESVLFHREDVWDATDESLISIANDVLTHLEHGSGYRRVSSPCTITRGLTMVFVNWGFKGRIAAHRARAGRNRGAQ